VKVVGGVPIPKSRHSVVPVVQTYILKKSQATIPFPPPPIRPPVWRAPSVAVGYTYLRPRCRHLGAATRCCYRARRWSRCVACGSPQSGSAGHHGSRPAAPRGHGSLWWCRCKQRSRCPKSRACSQNPLAELWG
jgi:hypothetical protein